MLQIFPMEKAINQALIDQFSPVKSETSYFLSFEGIEGAGKSTQINNIVKYLKEHNFTVIQVREPGGTIFGEKLREAILQSNEELHPIAEAHLFASSRAQLLKEITLKKLMNKKTIVIYDRYIDSSIAYQGIARNLGVNTVLEIHKEHPLTVVPHCTFYIRINLETSMERQKIRNQTKDYFESRGKNFYEKLIKGYDLASKIFNKRIIVINGEQNPDIVTKEIINSLNSLLKI